MIENRLIDARFLMQGVTVQHLRFKVRAAETIFFENEPGAALRGALYEALSTNFCSEAFSELPAPAHHQDYCPVCWLLAAENPHAGRGHNIPRPLTLQPPVGQMYFSAGQTLHFGISLIGKAQDLLPYIARAVQKMGGIGVGRGRGRFTLIGIEEVHPLLDTKRMLMDGRTVKRPTLQVTPAVIHDVASQLPTQAVTLELLTPMRLTAAGGLVKEPSPVIFMQRLLERCQNLAEHYAEHPPDAATPTRADWLVAHEVLIAQAASLKIGYNHCAWAEAFSGSRRTGRVSPLSGLVGRVRWEGDVTSLLPWLLWGTTLHVGKNAVKGSGYYRVIRAL